MGPSALQDSIQDWRKRQPWFIRSHGAVSKKSSPGAIHQRAGFVSSPTFFRSFSVKPCSRKFPNEPKTADFFNVAMFRPVTRPRYFTPPVATKVRGDRPLQSSARDLENSFKTLCNTPEYDKLKAREVGMDAKFQLLRLTKIRPPIVLPKDVKSMIGEQLQKPDDTVLISKFSIDFCRKDLATLCPSRWLNDEVINFYFQLINSRSEKSQGSLPFIHVFTSFFYPKLRDRGYEAVRTSTRRLMPSVLSRDMILFPIHLGSHWCLAVIDFQEKTISYYDSLHGRNEQCLKSIRNWLAMESRDKLQVEFDFAGWQERCCNDIPSQKNGYDCGVFTLVFAEHISRRAAFSFSQADMIYWRDRISYEILVGTLLV